MKEKISSQIKKFEKIYNGVEEAFIDIAEVKKAENGFFCTITIYSDDLSDREIYKNIFYSAKILEQI